MKMKRYLKLGALALGLLVAACNKAENNSADVAGLGVPVEGVTIASGNFEGRSDHAVSGQVEILEADGKFVVSLGADFSLDGAPDPKVGLGKDGYVKSTKAGALKKMTGASSYELPAGVDPKDYDEVYIWCEKFGVPLGVAKLTAK